MKNLYVRDLVGGKRIQDLFWVKNKIMAVDRQGKPYLIVQLADRTGEVEARLWENVEHFSKKFDVNDIVEIDGWTQLYQGRLQIKLIRIFRSESVTNLEDFFPAGRKSRKEVRRELKNLLTSFVRDRYLSKLLDSFFQDEEFMDNFLKSPAAKSLHHAYVGGLAEHTLSVVKVVIKLSEHYRTIYGDKFNPEVAVTGAFLHDLGKIRELSLQRSFNYTDEGRLLGHIIQGIQLVEEKMNMIEDFPPLLRMHLLHIIASHHGSYEFGSPKRPKTLEALLVHYADDLDSKMESFGDFIEKDNNEDPRWTGYFRNYERYLFRETYESEKEAEPSRAQLRIFSDLED